MTLTVTDTLITSDVVGEVAHCDNGRRRHVTGYPGRTFDRNQAITAVSLAELEARGITTDRDRALASTWRVELDA